MCICTICSFLTSLFVHYNSVCLFGLVLASCTVFSLLTLSSLRFFLHSPLNSHNISFLPLVFIVPLHDFIFACYDKISILLQTRLALENPGLATCYIRLLNRPESLLMLSTPDPQRRAISRLRSQRISRADITLQDNRLVDSPNPLLYDWLPTCPIHLHMFPIACT